MQHDRVVIRCWFYLLSMMCNLVCLRRIERVLNYAIDWNEKRVLSIVCALILHPASIGTKKSATSVHALTSALKFYSFN